jgi:lysophospholipase L1-like esterase
MKILCFGDSNTYGYDPRSYFGDRYAEIARWVNILSEELKCLVINAGEKGREVPHTSWEITEFSRLLVMEQPIDCLIIMLGTNDLLQGNDAATVANRMKVFLRKIDFPSRKILLIAPPGLKLGEWVDSAILIDASKELHKAYQRLAESMGMNFVNAGEWNPEIAFDGVHLTEEGHRTLAYGLLQHFRNGE